MSDPPTETELKFLIAPHAVGGLLKHRLLRGETTTARLRSVYYDTPGLDLRDAGFSLRVRRTGHRYVQTVKTLAAGGPRRGEWEAPVRNQAVDRAVLADTPAGESLDGKVEALAPLYATMVERRTRTVAFDDARIEVSFDRGVLSSGEASEAIEELELELKSGEVRALFGLARELARAAPLRLSFESKADRGLRLRDGAAADPRKARPISLSAAMPSSEAFQHIARACLAQVTANAEVLSRLRRPEAIHQLRIGLRRLRTAMSIFRTMLGDDGRDALGSELAWLAGELDSARDIDVFGKTTFRPAAQAPASAGLAQLGRHLQKAKRLADDRALAAVGSQRYTMLSLEAAAWIETGAWADDTDPVRAHLRSIPITQSRTAALDHLRHVVRRRGRGLEHLDPASRHKLRIRAKRLRYAVEFFASLTDHRKRQARFLACLEAMQDQLGELNDIDVARERLMTEAAVTSAKIAFAAGRAVGRREKTEQALIRAAAKGYKAFRSAEPFWT